MLTAALVLVLTQAHGSDPAPATVDVSDEARHALSALEPKDGFVVDVWASEPLLANPVAFTFDWWGRAYVAETYRHSKGVTDLRGHMDWVEEDLGNQTVEARVDMIRRREGEEAFKAGYTVESERVRRVVDADGDGVADSSTVFAEGFDHPAAGIGAGLLTRPLPGGGTEVWFTCIPDVWRLFDEDNDGVAERREAHSSGYGLRVALLGHDLHGPIVGMDGRIYFTSGDRGFNVTSQTGDKVARFGQGAVLRCELDGSSLEVFCDGLRNPQEIVFDSYGNLFTLDNNSDSGDEARWTYLLEGSDTGWRQAYQWVEQPHRRGPWDAESMWRPFDEKQPAYVLPPIANFTSGPSGMTQYPGVGWGEAWNDTFLVCDFRGNPKYSGVYSFKNEPKGAGFAMVETDKLLWHALPTDVEFGMDGDLYVSDWVAGWNQTGKGRIFRMRPEDRPEGEAEQMAEVKRLLTGGLLELGDEELVQQFHHRDRRVRQEAQLALTARALAAVEPRAIYDHLLPAIRLMREPGGSTLARTHAIWAVAHAYRLNPLFSESLPGQFIALLFQADEEIVVQAIRALGDVNWKPSARRLPPFLIHENPRIQLAAAEALGKVAEPIQAGIGLLELLELHGRTDPWLRHAAIRSLEQLGDPATIHDALGHPAAHVRRALAVVLRRQKDTLVALLLDDEDELVRAEAVRAIYDTPITEAMGELALFLERAPAATDGLSWRRMLQANREVGDVPSARRLAAFAASDRGPSAARAEALTLLAGWTQSRSRDGILMDHRPSVGGDAADLAGLADAPILTRAWADQVIESKAAELALPLSAVHRSVAAAGGTAPERAEALSALAFASGLTEDARRRAFEALLELDGGTKVAASAVERAREEGGILAPIAYGTMSPAQAASALLAASSKGSLSDRAESLRILGGLRSPEAGMAFARIGKGLTDSDATLVDWLEAAQGHPDERVSLVRDLRLEAWAASDDALDAWRMCLEGGDPLVGRKLFASKSETSCMKCHIVGTEGGSEAGPALDTVGERLTAEEILRSIVEPNATIAEGFQSWLLLTDDGEAFSGRIVEETADLVVLENNKKEQYEFEPGEIQVRKRDVSAMPGDVSTHLTRREMRDLVAFLRSLKP